jgi:hypothetical protein
MKRIALLTLTALAALVLAATAAAANTPGAGADDLFAQPADSTATPPATLKTKSTRKPRAKAVRHLSIGLISSETTSVFRGCGPTYKASWGGWEIQCAFSDFHQGVFVGDEWRYYYWDGATPCWRFYQYYFRGVAYLGAALNPWTGPYAAPRTCF